MNPSASQSLGVEQILREHYVDGVFHTHVSMVQPRGKFQFNRQALENFWAAYCKKINENENTIVGVAEKPQHYLPVLADVDLKVKDEGDIKYDEHLYTEEHVAQVIEVYQSVLRNIVEGCTDDHLLCVLLEKPMYYLAAGETTYVKNGFHLHFPNLFLNRVDQEVHLIPRVQDAIQEMQVFADLGIENSGNMIDKACCSVPWLLYGSRKSEDMDPYKVTKVYNSEGIEIELEEAFRHYRIYDMKEKQIQIRGKVEEYLPRILSIIPYGRSTQEVRHGLISPLKEKMQDVNTRKKSNIKVSVEEALKISEKLLPLLADWRAEDRNEWMTIGWILFNIGDGSVQALEQWLEFSSRDAEKYDEAQCIYEWDRMVKRDLTLGTLKHYASVDNPELYKKFKQEQADPHVKEALNGSHNDIAKILYAEYGNEFVCASISGKTWYQFRDHRWEEIEEGVFLREKISADVVEKYALIGGKLFNELVTLADKSDMAKCQTQLKQVQKLMTNLKSAPYKANCMKEAMDVFYDRRFRNKLDQNPYLIGFSNGVYDLKVNEFRPGRPEDFISKVLPIEYKEYDMSDEDVQNVIDFMQKVFPDPEIREYFLDTYSDVFVGGNNQKKVYMWTGDGDNGKSITQLFFDKMLGELAIKFNTQYFTGKKVSAGSANPELARAAPPVRLATMEEPDADEQLNIGELKKLSGGDSFWARDLFERGKNTREVTPLFMLTFICLGGNTCISLSNGCSLSLKNLRSYLDLYKVNSWDSEGKGIVVTKPNKFLVKGRQECVTLTLQDNRKITCTPDHQFLTSDNQWIKASDINLDETQLKLGPSYPLADDICQNYDFVLEAGDNVSYDMMKIQDRLKAAALCRIMGYMITDGSGNRALYIGHRLDTEIVLDDIYLLTKKRPAIIRNNIYMINIPSQLTKCISTITKWTGKRLNNETYLPEFLFDTKCPTFLIREFIASMFGGDGIVPPFLRNTFGSLQLICSKRDDLVNNAIGEYEKLSNILSSRFGIESYVRTAQYETNKQHIFLTIGTNDSILTFCEKIGFRYCYHKIYRMVAVASCLSYKNSIIQQNSWIVNRTKELWGEYKKTNPKPMIHQINKETGEIVEIYTCAKDVYDIHGHDVRSIRAACRREGNAYSYKWEYEYPEDYIFSKKRDMTLLEALEQAKDEYRKQSEFISEQYMVTCSQIRCNYIHNNRDYTNTSVNLWKYMEENDLSQFVNQQLGKGKIHYSLHEDSTVLPTFNMTVVGRKNVGECDVFDLNMDEKYSNFLAEGIITHNCNKLPKLKYSDKATWNRIRVIPFEAVFVEPGEPCPETLEEQMRQKRFPMDKDLKNKVSGMVTAFAWYLLEWRQKMSGPRREPEKVREATAIYRRQNDIYRQFIEESIIEDDSVLTITELYAQFKEWFKEGWPNMSLPIKNEVKEYFERCWGECERGIRWTGYRIRTLQDGLEDGSIVILGSDDLVNYGEDGKALPPM